MTDAQKSLAQRYKFATRPGRQRRTLYCETFTNVCVKAKVCLTQTAVAHVQTGINCWNSHAYMYIELLLCDI